MRYLALASDYDGTLATHGQVEDDVRAGLIRLRGTGRKIILVTGRRLDDLQSVCPDLSPFDIVVAENGALLYWPDTKELRPLVEPPPPLFAETLLKRGVPDVARGHVIVATWQPYETVVLNVIRELGLELQVIFNKGAVMILPSGVNKATGLRAALDHFHLSPHNVVGLGDAENDHALLASCECGVAVANALPMLRERADLVTSGSHGRGVLEIAEQLMADDLAALTSRLPRQQLPLGASVEQDAGPIMLPPYGSNLLFAGGSAAEMGLATGSLLQILEDRGYQYCLFDLAGRHAGRAGAVVMGSAQELPPVEQVVQALQTPTANVVVNLAAAEPSQWPGLFAAMLERLHTERRRTGHPHWLVIDDAHRLVPHRNGDDHQLGGTRILNLVLVTDAPEKVTRVMLAHVDLAVLLGDGAAALADRLGTALDSRPPVMPPRPGRAGDATNAIAWWVRRGERPAWFRMTAPLAHEASRANS